MHCDSLVVLTVWRWARRSMARCWNFHLYLHRRYFSHDFGHLVLWRDGMPTNGNPLVDGGLHPYAVRSNCNWITNAAKVVLGTIGSWFFPTQRWRVRILCLSSSKDVIFQDNEHFANNCFLLVFPSCAVFRDYIIPGPQRHVYELAIGKAICYERRTRCMSAMGATRWFQRKQGKGLIDLCMEHS